MKSRYNAILATGILVLLFSMLSGFYGYENTWELWNIRPLSPHFADIRTITHGAESFANGIDPMVENPGDPWGRRLNYPRIWQSLYSLGLNESHTTYFGLIIIALFLIGICLFLPNASTLIILLVFAAVLSPATLLAIERANIDLLMFFLASLAIVISQRSYVWASIVVLLGFILKLFPIFAGIILFGVAKSKFILYTLLMSVCVGLYIFVSWSDILLISESTPISISTSYGLNVFWMGVSSINENLGIYTRILSYFLSFLILIIAFSSLWRKNEHQVNNNIVFLNAFRVGASIYVGTFLLGNNWDYRLIFLIFTIPQLVIWTRLSVSRIVILSKISLVVIYISLWYLVIRSLFSKLPYGDHIGSTFDEMSNWLAFACLAYLLIWSLPNWVRELIRRNYPLTNRSS